MAEKIYALKEKRNKLLNSMLADYTAGKFDPAKAPGPPPGKNSRTVACLVETVESFGAGRAIALAPNQVSHAFTIWHAGSLPDPLYDDASFTLQIGLEQTDAIPIFATAKEMEDILSQLDSLSADGSFDVSLGTINDPELLPDTIEKMYPRRWFIEFDGRIFEDPPSISIASSTGLLWRPFVAKTIFRATDLMLNVTCPFYIAEPSQLVPGTIVSLDWFDAFGWGIESAEARMFDGCGDDLGPIQAG